VYIAITRPEIKEVGEEAGEEAGEEDGEEEENGEEEEEDEDAVADGRGVLEQDLFLFLIIIKKTKIFFILSLFYIIYILNKNNICTHDNKCAYITYLSTYLTLTLP